MTWPITHTTTIKGLRRVGQIFGSEVATIVRDDLSTFGALIGEEAKSTAMGLAPERTGYLKRHIQFRIFVKADAVILRLRSTAPYSWYVERGVKSQTVRTKGIKGKPGRREHHVSAHPFMRPAILLMRRRATQGVQEALAPAVEAMSKATAQQFMRAVGDAFK